MKLFRNLNRIQHQDDPVSVSSRSSFKSSSSFVKQNSLSTTSVFHYDLCWLLKSQYFPGLFFEFFSKKSHLVLLFLWY